MISTGDIFEFEKVFFLLLTLQIDGNNYCFLICLSCINDWDGRPYCNPVIVKNYEKLTQKEWVRITDGDFKKFKKLEGYNVDIIKNFKESL